MTDVLIKRELLERVVDYYAEGEGDLKCIAQDCREALAAPRQPEGDGLEVVGYLLKKSNQLCMMKAGADDEPLCRWKDARRGIAELREECEHLKACQENAMLHMTGLVAERNTLLQQLAERDAELKKVKADRVSCWAEFKVVTRACLEAEKERNEAQDQRDKLAGLLREVRGYTDSPHIVGIIDAALAEVNK